MIPDQKWRSVFEEHNALWIHDGNPARPHVELTSGEHSEGFFNSELVLEWPGLMDQACTDLVEMMMRQMIEAGFNSDSRLNIGRVVGPAMGAITLAHDMARTFGAARGKPCRRAYVEKDPAAEKEGKKRMMFTRTAILPSELVLLTEDVITSGGSVMLMADAVERGGGTVVPFLPVIVNRSGETHIGHMKVVALIDHPMPKWKPEECPLCQQGSQALRAKANNNWKLLNADY